MEHLNNNFTKKKKEKKKKTTMKLYPILHNRYTRQINNILRRNGHLSA